MSLFSTIWSWRLRRARVRLEKVRKDLDMAAYCETSTAPNCFTEGWLGHIRRKRKELSTKHDALQILIFRCELRLKLSPQAMDHI